MLRGGYIHNTKVTRLFTRWVVICFLALLPNLLLAQQSSIRVYGKITENDKKLLGATVQIYANGSLLRTINCDNGKYEVNLELGVDYTIACTKPGYITKRVEFNTNNVPAERAKYPFSDFPIDFDIFPEVPGVDIDQVLQKPIGKIAYDATFNKVGDFNSDENYHQSIQAELNKIEEARKQAADQAKQLDAQYKAAIAKADKEFNSKDYDNAKADYLAASAIKQGEQYPKDQIAKIDQAKKDMAASDAQKAQQQVTQNKYDSLIKLGDGAFAAQNWDNARKLYNAAHTVKPNETKPTDQLAAIDKAIADGRNKALQHKYDSIVKIGDANFKTKSWDNAKAAYNSAITLMPSQQYPKDQLVAINQAIAADAAAADAKKKHQQDSIAAAQAKALADAKKKHQQDSIAAAQAKALADAKLKHQQDSIASAQAKALADAKKKHQQDSIAAAQAKSLADAKKKHQQDSIAAAQAKALADAKLKHQQDSIAAAQAKSLADAKKKHQQDSIATAQAKSLADAKKKHQQDSIAAAQAKALADAKLKHQQDSIAAAQAKALADAKNKHQQDSIAAAQAKLLADAKKKHQQDSIAAAQAKALADAKLKHQQDSIAAAQAKALADAKNKHQQDSIAAAQAKALADAKKKHQQDSIAAAQAKALADAKNKHQQDSIAATQAKALADAKKRHQQDSIAAAQAKALADAKNKHQQDSIAAAQAKSLADAKKKHQQDSIAAAQAKALADAKNKHQQDSIAAAQTKSLADAKRKHQQDSLAEVQAKALADAKNKHQQDSIAAAQAKAIADAKKQRDKDSIATRKALDDKYRVAIQKADQLKMTNNLKAALPAYQDALAIEPDQQYPKDQIARIKGILDRAAQANGGTTNNGNTPDGTANGNNPNNGQNPDEKDSLAKKYPPGTTEEHYDVPGCEVTVRIVVKGNHGAIYTKKVWSWGQTYYLKGDQPITEDTWTSETSSN